MKDTQYEKSGKMPKYIHYCLDTGVLYLTVNSQLEKKPKQFWQFFEKNPMKLLCIYTYGLNTTTHFQMIW